MQRQGSTEFRVCEITNNPSERSAGREAGTEGGVRPRKVIVADLFESMGLISQLKEFRGKGEGFVFRFT